MNAHLELRMIRCLDGLHYSFAMLKYHYEGMHDACCKINDDKAKVVIALVPCWGFIDSLHRIREISLSTPGVNNKHREMRAFLVASELAEDFRHYIQHLRGELASNPPNTFPVWGVSWVDKDNELKCHTALLGASFEGLNLGSCVFDSVSRVWVSKVCLEVNGKSFNFDPIYKSCIRFYKFIIEFIVERASDNVKFHDKLPIFTSELKLCGNT